MVQSPFHPEGWPCHVSLLHPPGGLVAGDRLDLRVECAPGAHALITTPASGKVYRSAGPEAFLHQSLQVAEGATLEWLPAETIVFDGARCRSRTAMHLARGSRLLAWEAWGLGRPACGEGFDSGHFVPSLEVTKDGRPLLVERNRTTGGGDWLRLDCGLAGHGAAGTVLAHPGDEVTLTLAREAIADSSDCMAAASLVDGLLTCRVLARGLAPLRRQLEAWWRALRPAITGLAPAPPRIWAT